MTHWRDRDEEIPANDVLAFGFAVVVMAVPVLAVWLIYTGWG